MDIKKPCTLICECTSRKPSIYLDGLGLYYFRYVPAKGLKIQINIPDTGKAKLKGLRVLEIKPIDKVIISAPLPKKERDISKEDYQVFEKRQFSPASINHKEGRIYVNPEFNKYPYPFKVFIMLHELAHRFYKTEWKCDLWALVTMCEMGYNASSAFYCLNSVLSRNYLNIKRTKKLFNNIPKSKTWKVQ